jgi:peroxiredoxin
MARMETPVCDFGAAAVDFRLPGVDGRDWTLAQCAGPNGLLVMFICNHCPFVQAIRERLVRDARALREHGIHSVAIMSNDTTQYPEDSFERMQAVAHEFDYPFPYLLDASQDVARAYGAVCTPDFFGYNRQLQLQYRGRLDASGKQAASPGAPRELFDAMCAVAATGRGPEHQVPSIGCSIKWREPERAGT